MQFAVIALICLFSVSFTQYSSASEEWEPIGPTAASVFSYARHPVNPDFLLLGSHFGGLYRSFDGGFTWEHLDTGFNSAAVFSITAVSSSPGAFYVGTFERGVFYTDDNGESWEARNNGLTDLTASSVAVNPFDKDEVLVATFSGIFSSLDGGVTWETPSSSASVPSIFVTFSQVTDGVCYVGSNGSGVLRSANSGRNWVDWSSSEIENSTVFWLESDPDNLDEIYMASDQGVARRAEGESAWTEMAFNLDPEVGANHIAFHPDKRIFAATNLGVFTLTDRNATQWFDWNSLPSRFILIEPFGDHIQVAGTELTLRVTFDDGLNFANSASGIQNLFPDAIISVPAQSGSYIFAGTDIGPVRNVGPSKPVLQDWADADVINKELILELRADPADNQIIYAGTERAGVWKSSDTGVSWVQSSSGILPSTIESLTQSSEGDHTMYAGTSVGLFLSRDNGITWQVGPEVAIPSFVTAVETDAAAENVAYFGTNFGGFLRTIDDGLTFQSTSTLDGERIEVIESAKFRDVFAVTASGRVFSSGDQALTWDPKDADINHPGVDLAFDDTQPWVGYLATRGGGVYKTSSEGTQWQQMNSGIDNLFILSVIVDQVTPSVVYAGSVGAIFKSIDAGLNWSKHTSGLPSGKLITDLIIDSSNNSRLYASVLGEGVYRSDDGGEQWLLLSSASEFTGANAVPLGVSYASEGGVFAGSEKKGIFRSEDQGVNWQSSSSGVTDLVRGIQVSFQDSNVVYAGSLNSGVFRSENAGLSWEAVGLEKERIIHMGIDPFDDRRVWAATAEGVSATFDGGDSWQSLGQRLSLVFSLISDPSSPNKVFIGGAGGGFYSSPDSMRTSKRGGAGLPEVNMLSMTISPSGDLYAGLGFGESIGEGVVISDNEGGSWNKISGNRFDGERVTQVYYAGDFDQLYVVGDKSGLVLGLPDGSAWQTIVTPGGDPELNPITQFCVSEFDANQFYVSKLSATGQGISVFVSSDRGATWSTVQSGSGLPLGSVRSLAVSPVTSGLVAASHELGVYISSDDGETWEDRSGSITEVVLELFFDPNHSQRLFAGTSNGEIYVSEDLGQTWNRSAVEPSGSIVSGFIAGANGRVHAGLYTGGVITSSDGGVSWSEGLDPSLAKVVANFISVDQANPDTLYLATTAQGPLKSVDGGFTWKKVNSGLGDNLTALTILVDPKDPDVVYVGTNTDGVYVSENAAESWEPLREGMLHELVIALAVDAADHRVVYAGVEGGGVYRIQRPRKTLSPNSDHDLDGISSIEERFMGLDPLRPNPPGYYSTQVIASSSELELTYQSASVQNGVSAEVEWSEDLIDWYKSSEGPTGTGPLIMTENIGIQPAGYRLYRATLPFALDTNRFLRLKYSEASGGPN